MFNTLTIPISVLARYGKAATKQASWIAKPLHLHATAIGDCSIAGKTLLIHAEQGFGDTLQFCRYVLIVDALAKSTGARMLLEVPPALMSLLVSLKSNATLIARGQALPEFDLQCPLMSLPLACKTTLDTIPADVPYLFADVNKQAAWQQRLGVKCKPRIGLVWSGIAGYLEDRNRSIPLSMLERVTEFDLEFHSLQKEIRSTDQMFLSTFNIKSHTEQLTDFAETAALVMEMDLIISVDTSVAHLAGAAGRPVWVLLPFSPDWRWLLDRKDSPWYPNATLFRQPKRGDWESVVDGIVEGLGKFTTTSCL